MLWGEAHISMGLLVRETYLSKPQLWCCLAPQVIAFLLIDKMNL